MGIVSTDRGERIRLKRGTETKTTVENSKSVDEYLLIDINEREQSGQFNGSYLKAMERLIAAPTGSKIRT